MKPYSTPEADCVKIQFKIFKGEQTGTHLIPHYYLALHRLMSYMYHSLHTVVQDTFVSAKKVPWKSFGRQLLMMTPGSSSLPRVTQNTQRNASPSSSMVMVCLAQTAAPLLQFHLNQYLQKGAWAQIAAYWITFFL